MILHRDGLGFEGLKETGFNVGVVRVGLGGRVFSGRSAVSVVADACVRCLRRDGVLCTVLKVAPLI